MEANMNDRLDAMDKRLESQGKVVQKIFEAVGNKTYESSSSTEFNVELESSSLSRFTRCLVFHYPKRLLIPSCIIF